MKHLRKNKLQVYCTLQQVSFPDHYDFFFLCSLDRAAFHIVDTSAHSTETHVEVASA